MLSYPCENTLDLHTVDRLIVKRDRTSQRENEKYADQNTPVADAVHDKCLLGSTTSLIQLDVITNEEVRAESDAFPTNEHQQKIIGKYQRQHRKHEQVHVREEPIKTFIAVHVTGGKDVDQKSDERYETDINTRKPIHA